MAAAVPESDIRQVIAEVKSLIVNQLKEILRSEGFGAFSNLRKPELQERVISRVFPPGSIPELRCYGFHFWLFLSLTIITQHQT